MKSMRLLYNNKHDGYWRNQISINKGISQALRWTLLGILGDSVCDDTSPFSDDNYAKYFKDKINSMHSPTAATPTFDVSRRVTSSFAEFTAVTDDDMAKLISCMPNKPCQLDPVPKWLVKDMSELLLPFIALLINKLLTAGCFPAKFKVAIVQPLLKKDGLNFSNLKNYRPVSNLQFLSKLLERVVQACLLAHLNGNSFLPGWQSAYLYFCRNETASSIDQLQQCVLDISHWMSDNRLKLTPIRRNCCLPAQVTAVPS